MQGQRSSVDPFPDKLEFDHTSRSNTGDMDQENFWNSMLLHSAESHNLPDCLLSPIDSEMLPANIATEGSSNFSLWSSNGSSSSDQSQNHENHENTKLAEDSVDLSIWSSNAPGPRSASPINAGPIEVENLLSLEDVDMNLSIAQIDDGQSFSFSQSSDMDNVPEELEHGAVLDSVGGEASRSRVSSSPFTPNLLERQYHSSSNSHASSSGVVGFKRKNIEGFPGQSAASGSVNFLCTGGSSPVVSVSNNASAGMNISSPSSNISSCTSSEQLNPRFSAMIRGNAESSRRNFRLRSNPAHQNDIYPPNIYSSRNALRNSNILVPNEPLSHPIASDQRAELREAASTSSLQQPPRVPVIPVLPRNPHIYPRNVGLTNSINSSETLRAIWEETITRSHARNNLLEQPLLTPRNEVRSLVQGSANGNATNGSAAAVVGPTSIAGTSSGVNSLVESMWVPSQNSSTRPSISLVDAVQSTALASGSGFESGGQGSNLLSHRSSHSVTSQDTGHLSGSLSRGNQQARLRSALLMDRQNDGGLSLRSVAAREGRNRMILEIRNALDLMRRGGNLQIEDALMLDHPVFHRVADLHDRHREMRLDVDNMSYEELLALEERIGNVSTGLGEETILKCLKKRKHSPVDVRTMVEPEPCCICQEEYAEGEDLGALDCGHDFHSDCIKQWLMQKNLCPICKATALKT